MEGRKLQSFLHNDSEAAMIRKEEGFTMVELMITMVIFVIVIAAASQVFTGLLTQFKQQSKISETNTEGIVGIEVIRRDLAEAGLGLPWWMTTGGTDATIGNTATYTEAINDGGTFWDDMLLNDAPNPPAAFRLLTSVGIHDSGTGNKVPNSTAVVLSIKAVNVAMNDNSQRWTYVANNGALPNAPPKVWNSPDDVANSDLVIVLNPSNGSQQNVLQNTGGSSSFFKTLGDTTNPFSFKQSGPNYTANAFEPQVNSYGKFIVYGIAPSGVTPRMPFNRADYYVKIPSTNVPKSCAPNTGMLYKGTINNTTGNSDSGKHLELPILDCVADFQVDFVLVDNNGNIIWPPTSNISGLAASDIRAQVKEIRVYIVAHEGQKDINYDFSEGGARTSISTLEVVGGTSRTLDSTNFFVDLKNLVGDPEYKYYRWKLYTLVVQPNSLR